MSENHLKASLGEHQFFYSAELVLGRDHSVGEAEAFVLEAAKEQGEIKIISLTDLPGGNPALPPEAFVSFISERGLTPLAHLTGKDGNRGFLEARLLHMARIGAENVLVLTGDAQKSGFLGRSKPVYDLDSVLILKLIGAMRSGIQYQMGVRTVRSTPFDFLSGAVINPFKTREPDQMMQFFKLHLKAAAGAQFIITQLGFNLRKLYELKQYMMREGLGHVPVVANVYVPTATIARLMQSGDVAGCVVTDRMIKTLQGEKKPQRLERAALMVAAARDLGFAGAHIGGFGLSYLDFVSIICRSNEIGPGWKGRLDELIFDNPGDFYLFPQGGDGLSNGNAGYSTSAPQDSPPLQLIISRAFHQHVIRPESSVAQFLSARLRPVPEPQNDSSWRHGFWYSLLNISSSYRKAVLGCESCGDCIQDHLNYAGCTMHWCYKGLRNGPCGGSRIDGTCEAYPDRPCRWNVVYLNTRAGGENPRKFAETIVPPRDWSLDDTNALANRYAGIDNYDHREKLSPGVNPEAEEGKSRLSTDKSADSEKADS